jgi:hypothetical protein
MRRTRGTHPKYAYAILKGKFEEKIQIWRFRHNPTWNENMNINLKRQGVEYRQSLLDSG